MIKDKKLKMPITGSKIKLNGELSLEPIVEVAKTRRMIETLTSFKRNIRKGDLSTLVNM